MLIPIAAVLSLALVATALVLRKHEDYAKRSGAEKSTRHDSAQLVQDRNAAERGDPEAQFILGMYYDDEDGGQDFEEAIKWYRLAAEQGFAEAQNNLD